MAEEAAAVAESRKRSASPELFVSPRERPSRPYNFSHFSLIPDSSPKMPRCYEIMMALTPIENSPRADARPGLEKLAHRFPSTTLFSLRFSKWYDENKNDMPAAEAQKLVDLIPVMESGFAGRMSNKVHRHPLGGKNYTAEPAFGQVCMLGFLFGIDKLRSTTWWKRFRAKYNVPSWFPEQDRDLKTMLHEDEPRKSKEHLTSEDAWSPEEGPDHGWSQWQEKRVQPERAPRPEYNVRAAFKLPKEVFEAKIEKGNGPKPAPDKPASTQQICDNDAVKQLSPEITSSARVSPSDEGDTSVLKRYLDLKPLAKRPRPERCTVDGAQVKAMEERMAKMEKKMDDAMNMMSVTLKKLARIEEAMVEVMERI